MYYLFLASPLPSLSLSLALSQFLTRARMHSISLAHYPPLFLSLRPFPRARRYNTPVVGAGVEEHLELLPYDH